MVRKRCPILTIETYLDFVVLGFRIGSVFQIAGTANNDGEYTVKSFTQFSIEVTADGSLVDETTPTLGAEITMKGPTDACNVMEVVQGTHEASVCSGRGLCDRKYGNCECIHGFSGRACSIFYADSP